MAKAKKKKKVVLRHRTIRFPPDPGTLAEVTFEVSPQKTLTLFGLVLNESSTGCALVLMSEQKLKEAAECKCRVGHLPKTDCVIRWVKTLDKDLYKIGLEYFI